MEGCGGDESCDFYKESDAMMDRMEAQRQAFVRGEARKEREKQDRIIDSVIGIPSSSVPFSRDSRRTVLVQLSGSSFSPGRASGSSSVSRPGSRVNEQAMRCGI
jgi:hypothetical protein